MYYLKPVAGLIVVMIAAYLVGLVLLPHII